MPPLEAPLRVYTTVASLRSFRQELCGSHRTLGFVPTMGALHEGHLALVRQAAAENDAVAVSIFVNPAQFSPSEDLAQYPRTLEADITALEDVNRSFGGGGGGGRIEALFLPSVAEMYPPNGAIPLDVSRQRGAFVSVQGPQGSRLEGASRPHFFRGVATVVAKLFNAVQADRAYFGQKDVQQAIVLRRMVADLLFPVQLRVCPTLRETDGLARSSRNVYLGSGERRQRLAPLLYRALQASEAAYVRLKAEKGREQERGDGGPAAAAVVIDAAPVLAEGLGLLCGVSGLEVEYFSLADVDDLEELDSVDVRKGGILSAAVRVLPSAEGETTVRLIDNIILEGDHDVVW